MIAADTGDALRNARIEAGDGPDAPAAFTDADGRFTLANVPSDQHDISVAKAGYAHASAPAADGVIALSKGGVITGRVLDDLGAPLALMNVVAIRRRTESGAPRFERVATADTDDQGEYRIFGLAAGDYVVAAAPGRVMSRTSLAPIPAQNLVLTHYFGPAETQEGARPLTVRAGEELPGIDFSFSLPTMADLQARGTPTPRPRPGAAPLNSLPPGDYYVAVLGRDGFAETGPLLEHEFLESLIAKGAVRITLTEGERRSVSVNVIGR